LTSIKLEQYLAKELKNIREQISDFNTFSCEKIATDLTKIFAIFEFPIGVFVGEFLEEIFGELDELKEYDLKEEVKKKILNKILDFLDYLLANPNVLCGQDLPQDIVKKMVDLRYIVTKNQIEVFRTKKKRRWLFSI